VDVQIDVPRGEVAAVQIIMVRGPRPVGGRKAIAHRRDPVVLHEYLSTRKEAVG
jgi:hypothetical protein